MNKKSFVRPLYFIIFIISISLVSCQNASKKVTVSDDTKSEILVDENEISKAMSTGEKYLSEGNFDEAKAYFNKAISLDKGNKDIYLKIKDKYMSLNRYDDAYFIIKTALANNVDIENMKLILKDISSNFDVIKLSSSIYQDSSYSLPTEVNATINDKAILLPIVWSNPKVDSTLPGTFIYEGFNEEYGRKVEMEITVLENVYDKQIGWVKNIYTNNGKLYIDVDLVEFYLGMKEALAESIKDGTAGINPNGEYFVPAPIYIRNNSDIITTYTISSDCEFSLCSYNLSPGSLNPSEQINISYDEFIKFYNNSKINSESSLLLWLNIKNGSIIKIEQQFLP